MSPSSATGATSKSQAIARRFRSSLRVRALTIPLRRFDLALAYRIEPLREQDSGEGRNSSSKTQIFETEIFEGGAAR
jgi:hypothetical protein